MRLNKLVAMLFLSAVLATLSPVAASTSPLGDFGALVVGEWEAEDSRHVLEWGVGQRTIRSRSYQKSGEGWTLVGEGMWYWDTSRKTIRGIAVAIGMPVDLFEYRSEVRGAEVVHNLVAQGPAGGEYVERWTFEDGEYRWGLAVETGSKPEQIMGGVYRRVGAKP